MNSGPFLTLFFEVQGVLQMRDYRKGEKVKNVFSRRRTLNATAHRNGALWLFLVFPFCFCCCNATRSDTTKNAVVQQQSTSANESPTHNTNDPLSPEMSKTVVGQVWRRFIQDGRYRLANASDFRFPEWAVKRQLLPQRDEIEVPFIATPIGYAAIVVNTNRDDEQRFGLVILTTDEAAKEGAEQKNVIHWFCRDKDLSRTAVGVSSGRVYLVRFEADGRYISCDIGWDANKRKFVCDKSYTSKLE